MKTFQYFSQDESISSTFAELFLSNGKLCSQQMMKMTFRKKDPELVTLFFADNEIPGGKPRQYRVSKRQEFINALQVYMLCLFSPNTVVVFTCLPVYVLMCVIISVSRYLLYVRYE
jgi:hypothetical protein